MRRLVSGFNVSASQTPARMAGLGTIGYLWLEEGRNSVFVFQNKREGYAIMEKGEIGIPE